MPLIRGIRHFFDTLLAPLHRGVPRADGRRSAGSCIRRGAENVGALLPHDIEALVAIVSPPPRQSPGSGGGSCWIPGSWICRGRLTSLLSPCPPRSPYFFNGLNKQLPFPGKAGAEDPGIQ